MKTIKLEIELTYDDKWLHDCGDDENPIGPTAARNNFYRGLMGVELGLADEGYNNEIGKVTVKRITMSVPKNKNQNGKKETALDL